MTNAKKIDIIPEVMDLKSITLASNGAPPEICTIDRQDGFFINATRNDDFRIRTHVYAMLKDAQARLPGHLRFMIFETYRTMAKQESLWNNTNALMKKLYPQLDAAALFLLCENFTANPRDGIGSGHQAACAIDLTLCDLQGNELPMGTAMHEKNTKTKTAAEGLTAEERQNRQLLKKAMEDAGLVNYPAEWWHFSYGDHQWAWLTGRKEAFYGPIDI